MHGKRTKKTSTKYSIDKLLEFRNNNNSNNNNNNNNFYENIYDEQHFEDLNYDHDDINNNDDDHNDNDDHNDDDDHNDNNDNNSYNENTIGDDYYLSDEDKMAELEETLRLMDFLPTATVSDYNINKKVDADISTRMNNNN